MHRELGDDNTSLRNVLKYFPCRYVFFDQSTDPVNDLNLVIKYVVSLLNSTQKSVKVSKKLASLNSTITLLIKNIDNLSFLFQKRHDIHDKRLAYTLTT